jgi:hypothetical protein
MAENTENPQQNLDLDTDPRIQSNKSIVLLYKNELIN